MDLFVSTDFDGALLSCHTGHKALVANPAKEPFSQRSMVQAGCSGTSFKTAPAIGKCLSEWITEGKATTVDLTPFRSTRFAEGKLWRDEHDYTVDQGTISR